MRTVFGLLGIVLVIGCGEAEETPTKAPVLPEPLETPFEPRFNSQELKHLGSFDRPSDLPCQAEVELTFDSTASTKIESFGYDDEGRLKFAIDITENGPVEKTIAFYEDVRVIGHVIFDYGADAPVEYDQFSYDDDGRLLKEERFRVTLDPDTLDWVPEPLPTRVIDHGYPQENEWRYNDDGILYTLEWDASARILTTFQGQSISRAYLSSDISLTELTRLGTSLSPVDWTAKMERGEYDEDGDGTVDYTVRYHYKDGRLVEVSDDADSVRFLYKYECDE